MNKLIGLREFREDVEGYSKRVSKGESFIVLRKSKPLFKISAVEEEGWETVIDFTAIQKGGVKFEDILSRL